MNNSTSPLPTRELPPEGFTPTYWEDSGALIDFESVVTGPGFTITQIWTPERGREFSFEPDADQELLSLDGVKDLAATLQALIKAAEA